MSTSCGWHMKQLLAQRVIENTLAASSSIGSDRSLRRVTTGVLPGYRIVMMRDTTCSKIIAFEQRMLRSMRLLKPQGEVSRQDMLRRISTRSLVGTASRFWPLPELRRCISMMSIGVTNVWKVRQRIWESFSSVRTHGRVLLLSESCANDQN